MTYFKTIFSSAAVFALTAGVAFANGASGGNQISITQTGPNYAEANQDCGPGGCNNKGTIVQVYLPNGAINNAYLSQVTANNQATIEQQGNHNVSNVTQRNGAKATSRQINAYDSYVRINQDKDEIDGTLSGFNNVASAYQSGIAHNALIKQFGDNGEARTSQVGDSNSVRVIQNKGSVGEYASVDQNGWGNFADVIENGQGDRVTLGQSGMKNNLDVDVAASSRRSSITAYQTGSFNNAKLYTQGSDNVILGDQNDTENYAEVVQLGNNQKAQYIQNGKKNNAFIGQYEKSNGSSAFINQQGNGLNAAIYQHCPNSSASITQFGTGANAIVRQQ